MTSSYSLCWQTESVVCLKGEWPLKRILRVVEFIYNGLTVSLLTHNALHCSSHEDTYYYGCCWLNFPWNIYPSVHLPFIAGLILPRGSAFIREMLDLLWKRSSIGHHYVTPLVCVCVSALLCESHVRHLRKEFSSPSHDKRSVVCLASENKYSIKLFVTGDVVKNIYI